MSKEQLSLLVRSSDCHQFGCEEIDDNQLNEPII